MKKEKFILIIIILGVITAELMMFVPSEITYVVGEFIAICLIISVVVALLVSDTKYMTENVSNIFDMISNSLLIIFIVMTIFRTVRIA